MTGAEILIFTAIYIAVGVLSGFIAGLLGVGGGIVIVPFLFQTYVMIGLPESVQLHLAVGSSLAIIVATSLQSARVHYAKGAVDMSVLRAWAPAIAFGAASGAVLGVFLSANMLKIIFGGLALLLALHLNLPMRKVVLSTPIMLVQRALAAVIGFCSALMGVGGGIFFVALLTLFGRSIHQAVGTSAGLGFFIALPGAAGFMLAGAGAEGLPPWSLGYVHFLAVLLLLPVTVWAAPYGARTARRFSRKMLERAFSAFLILVAVRLLASFFAS